MAKTTNHTPRMNAAHILDRVFFEEAYSHLALNEALQDSSLSEVDNRFVTEVVYGTIKRLNTLDYVLEQTMKQPFRKTDRRVKTILRMSAYQLLYMDRIPERAAINEGVELAKRWGRGGLKGFVNGVLRTVARQGLPDFKRISDPVQRIALETSHPEWLVRKWVQAYGEDVCRAMCETNLKRAYTTLRVNRLQTDRDTLQRDLQAEGIETSAGNLSPDSLIVTEGQAMHSASFAKGAFSFQDESSMLVTQALDVEAGLNVLDACAAPGGKTTYIAERMYDEGQVLANDIHPHKSMLIEQQVQRLGLESVTTRTEDATDLDDTFEAETFDRVLVDAPCSGLGVVRAKPDIKWQMNPEQIKELSALQLRILEAAAYVLKPGGTLVYSTCTLMPEENEEVVDAFLQKHYTSFAKDEVRSIFPQQYDSDGFFIAAMTKRGDKR
ncbi:16S rRNA (cytosine(967)-C(5))-methyltransferase RsmB [Natribacillus halophilus]|uniref:16S rRNA (cytosine(967)-C(5))-methyltransferase n=1 Tax=Natribacillus halophilus TaxID=549003 RepID=A0A1G8MJH2_9BACI|nr:16S rRNA (cytosine(967)-C(5))-methyltransferase RsmB [Natribacillus halophilus]SDI67470.1 16S rRNA (cytosine967-C5)-methyltransferase [Natribacillus halophilus]